MEETLSVPQGGVGLVQGNRGRSQPNFEYHEAQKSNVRTEAGRRVRMQEPVRCVCGRPNDAVNFTCESEKK